jgi:glycosyltransferase involved in cell wall biosynthesis
MKVAIVLATSAGGVGAHVRMLAQRLPDSGVDVTIACPAETERRFEFTATGASYQPVPIATGARPVRDWASVLRLRAVTAGADVVHAHGFRAAALTGLALGRRRPGRTPLVATWHNAVLGNGPRRRLLARIEALAARRSDLTLAVSPDLADRALELGSPDARLAPVPAPTLAAPSRTRAQVRDEFGAGERPIVLTVARLAPQKDYDTLLEASAEWLRRDPPPLVLAAGDGPEHDRLAGLIGARELPVRLLGRRTDIPDLLAAADVFVVTSRWEGSPLVVQEAMAVGVPVVSTAVGGVPTLVGEGAVLVKPGDPEAVARAVSALLDDPSERAALVERARAVAARWPDEAETARRIIGVYREVLAGGS